MKWKGWLKNADLRLLLELSVIGALIIGVMNNGLTILGLSSFWQYVAKGVVIVLAVLLDLH